MLCAIYKSPKKAGMYLYIAKRGQFDPIPAALMSVFGKPEFAMLFNLAGQKALAQTENQTVIEQITQQGYYLQLPKEDDGLFNSLSSIDKQ